jgi:addiction module RelE/StbE family toxin
MIRIELHRSFVKSFDKRIKNNPKLAHQVEERVNIFRSNPKSLLLKDHGLIGDKQRLRSFSITGDIRIVYRLVTDNLVEFIDIGSHNQVY